MAHPGHSGGGNPGGGNPGGGNPGGNPGGLIIIDGANGVDDVLVGTDEDELLRGFSGADLLDGRGGDDVLEGGKGNDELLGGAGGDTLDGGDDDDLLEGGSGSDIIDGDKGNDTATYRSSLSGVQVSLLAASQTGGDAAGDVLINIENLEGSAFNDTLAGDDQANRIAGLAGNDLLIGGAGDDTLEGGAGDDTLTGGEGADTFTHAGTSDGLDTISDFDPMADRIVLEGRAADYTWDEAIGALVHATSGHGIIFADPTTRPDAYAFTGSEITFTGGGVLLSSETAVGGSGGDDLLIYFGTATNVVLDGFGGNDRMIDLSPGAALRGDFGAQVGNDILEGRDGHTRFIGGLGDDTITGGLGADQIWLRESAELSLGDVFDGTAEAGTLDEIRIFDGGTYDFRGVVIQNIDQIVLTSGTSGSAQKTITLSDAMVSTADADGDGVAGDFLIRGDPGRVSGAVDVDASEITSSHSVTIDGSNFQGDDTLTGGAGDDVLEGGVGDDVLRGGPGADTVTGGLGADRIVVNGAAEWSVDDVVEGTEEAATLDTLELNNVITVTLIDPLHVDVIELNGNFNLTIAGTTAAAADYDQDGILGDLLVDVNGRGTVTVDAPASTRVTIDATDGRGGFLLTRAGNDTILGSAAADTIRGGFGVDSLVGGLGGDIFWYFNTGELAAGESIDGTLEQGTLDRIQIFNGGTYDFNSVSVSHIDEVVLSSPGSVGRTVIFSDAMVATADADQNGVLGDLRVRADTAAIGNMTIDASALSASSRVVVDGSNLGGDDMLTGGAGDDTLEGGDGTDVLHGGDGNDVLDGGGFVEGELEFLTGGAGNDILISGSGLLYGGEGDDFIDGEFHYEPAELGGVIINLSSADQDVNGQIVQARTAIDEFGDTDTFAPSVAFGHASFFDDTVIGSDADSFFFLRAGNDVIVAGAENDLIFGGAGDDTIDGGEGFDTADYSDDGFDAPGPIVMGVTVDLAAGTATDGWGDTDSLISIEGVQATHLADTIVGDDADNRLEGRAGDDVLEGGNGSDTLIGGAGDDTIFLGTDDPAITGDAANLSRDDFRDVVQAENNFGNNGTDTLFNYSDGQEHTAPEVGPIARDVVDLSDTFDFSLNADTNVEREAELVASFHVVDMGTHAEIRDLGIDGAIGGGDDSTWFRLSEDSDIDSNLDRPELVTVVVHGHEFEWDLLGGSNQWVEINGDEPDVPDSYGTVLQGIDEGDKAGFSVSSAGDINGDGIDDVIVGAYAADPKGGDEGETYVVFGASGGLPANLDLASLDGSNGFLIQGVDANDFSGDAVSSAGDVNGDGFDDIIVGAHRADPDGVNTGASYVVFGSDSGFSASLDLASLDGSNGFVIPGINQGDHSGFSVSGAGDVNGDGIDDVIIGARLADQTAFGNEGESYVVFGSDSGFSASLDLTSLDGSNGFVLNGIDENDRTGFSVSYAGDVNGDGIGDVIIGARFADPNGLAGAGESYVAFGSASGFSASLDLSALDGSNGFVIPGIVAGDQSGSTVSAAGDVNGDGIGDVIIGAEMGTQSYVLFGSDSGFSASFDLASLDGSNGFTIEGGNFRSVSNAGDVNGDGIDDLIVGSEFARNDDGLIIGKSFLIFGTASGFGASVDVTALDGVDGFVFNAVDVGDSFGASVSAAGDVNDDGIDDLLLGAPSADRDGFEGVGESYVIYGGQALLDDFDLADGSQDGSIDLEFIGDDPFA